MHYEPNPNHVDASKRTESQNQLTPELTPPFSPPGIYRRVGSTLAKNPQYSSISFRRNPLVGLILGTCSLLDMSGRRRTRFDRSGPTTVFPSPLTPRVYALRWIGKGLAVGGTDPRSFRSLELSPRTLAVGLE